MVPLNLFDDPPPEADALREALAELPPRHWQTPGGGTMLVATTRCGPVAWVPTGGADGGGHYAAQHPRTGEPWPVMPARRGRCGLPAVCAGFPPHQRLRTQHYRLVHGDVVVWGGPSRLRFHGVPPVKDGLHALVG